jgi:hypothetical protein
MSIWGARKTTVKKWQKLGFKTIQDLENADQKHIPPSVRLGLKYYRDFQKRIPREVKYYSYINTFQFLIDIILLRKLRRLPTSVRIKHKIF